MKLRSIYFLLPIEVFAAILRHLLGGGPLVLVVTEKGEDEVVKLGVLEVSPHGTPKWPPSKDVSLSPEEMLPVIGNVAEDSSQAPHVSRGRDVRILSQNLRGEVTDGATNLGGDVVHGGRGFTFMMNIFT